MTEIPSQTRPIEPNLESVAFLVGTWRGGGNGEFPTMDPFPFDEEIRFLDVGAPFLLYEQRSWSPSDGEALHVETGLWRPTGDGGIVVSVALSRVAEVSEGVIEGHRISLRSVSVGRGIGSVRLSEVHRDYTVERNSMTYDIQMATDDVPITHHIRAQLRRTS